MPGELKSPPREIQNHLSRISGPLLDRIDLHIEVLVVKFREIAGERTGETSAQIRERVIAARQRQHERFKNKPKITCNARMGSRELNKFCDLDEATKELLKNAMAELNLSARAYDRILKVARTIADLAGSEKIVSDHDVRGDSIPLARPTIVGVNPYKADDDLAGADNEDGINVSALGHGSNGDCETRNGRGAKVNCFTATASAGPE